MSPSRSLMVRTVGSGGRRLLAFVPGECTVPPRAATGTEEGVLSWVAALGERTRPNLPGAWAAFPSIWGAS